MQNTIKKLIIDDMEVTEPTCILHHIKDFYKALFKKCEEKTMAGIKDFLNVIDVPKLFEDQVKLFEEDLTDKNLYNSLNACKMTNLLGTTTRQKNFTKLFVTNCEKFEEIGHLHTSQTQDIIKLIEKRQK